MKYKLLDDIMVLTISIFTVYSAFTLYYQWGHYSKNKHGIGKEHNFMRGNKNLLALKLFMFGSDATEVPHQFSGITMCTGTKEEVHTCSRSRQGCISHNFCQLTLLPTCMSSLRCCEKSVELLLIKVEQRTQSCSLHGHAKVYTVRKKNVQG